MTVHDNKAGKKTVIEELLNSMPEFKDLSLDIQAIKSHSNDPFFVALLLYRTAKEQEKQNKLLENIYTKFDEIMFLLKSQSHSQPVIEQKNEFPVLAEQDEKILSLAEEKGKITAEEVKEMLGYKGLNAASQRLNKLFREGHLKKLRAGKKVVFIAGQ